MKLLWAMAGCGAVFAATPKQCSRESFAVGAAAGDAAPSANGARE